MTYAVFIVATIFIGIALFRKPIWLYALLSAVAYTYFFYLLDATFSFITLLVWLLGIILIVIEIYIPDFGIVGIVGLGACLFSLVTYTGSWAETILYILIGVLTIGFTIYFLMKTGHALVVSPQLVLQDTINTTAHRSQSETYQGLQVGSVGTTVSNLRPVGKVDFKGKIVEATSQTQFISANKQVMITEIVNQRIYVKEG